MSADTTAFATERDAILRRAAILGDLAGLLGIVPQGTLRDRWAALGATVDDLRVVRKATAKRLHPDVHRGDHKAAEQLAKANAAIDGAFEDLRRGNANAIRNEVITT